MDKFFLLVIEGKVNVTEHNRLELFLGNIVVHADDVSCDTVVGLIGKVEDSV